jgi:hypothetical protein
LIGSADLIIAGVRSRVCVCVRLLHTLSLFTKRDRPAVQSRFFYYNYLRGRIPLERTQRFPPSRWTRLGLGGRTFARAPPFASVTPIAAEWMSPGAFLLLCSRLLRFRSVPLRPCTPARYVTLIACHVCTSSLVLCFRVGACYRVISTYIRPLSLFCWSVVTSFEQRVSGSLSFPLPGFQCCSTLAFSQNLPPSLPISDVGEASTR